MRRARARMDQPGATVTVIDKQIDDLLSSIDEKEPAEPASKTRPKRSKKSEKRKRRVVITGMGALTPLGLTVDEYWQGLIDGRSGLGEVTLCDATGLDCMIDGEVKGFDPRNYMEHKEARRMARFSQLLVAASRAAIEDSGLKLDREDPYRLGVFVGNGLGGFPEAEDGCRTLISRGSSKVSPLFMPLILPNMAAGQVSMIFGLKGFTSTTTTACAAATQAIGEAAEVIRRNRADVILAGGTEAGITPTGIAGFCAMTALSTRNETRDPRSRASMSDASRQ